MAWEFVTKEQLASFFDQVDAMGDRARDEEQNPDMAALLYEVAIRGRRTFGVLSIREQQMRDKLEARLAGKESK